MAEDHGIVLDVHPFYQRGIRWAEVRGAAGVWVKASDGGAPYVKASAGVTYRPDTHVSGAKAAGLPVGVYHYAQPSPSPEVQATVLLGEVVRLGATGLVPLLDLEAPFQADAAARDFAVRFCRAIATAGLRPAVYMSSSWARALRPDNWGIPGLVIVVARYGAKPESAGPAQYTGRYDVHQYTSGGPSSPVVTPGNAGALDQSQAYTAAPFTEGNDDMDALQSRKLDELLEQMVGSRDADKYPGWPVLDPAPLTKATLVDFVRQTYSEVKVMQAQLSALAAAAEAATSAPDITKEELAVIVNDAVVSHLHVTGSFEATGGQS